MTIHFRIVSAIYMVRNDFMTIDPDATVTFGETKQVFPKIAKLAEEKGRVTVLQDGRPKLLVIDLDTEPQIEMTEDDKFEFVAARILHEHRAAFEKLAK